MRNLIGILSCAAVVLSSSLCFAEPTNITNQPHNNNFGGQLDVGAPDGIAIGFVARPNVNWLRLELAGTYNLMATGVRVGATIDPIKFWIAPSFTFEGGLTGKGTPPGTSNFPPIGYDYLNFHPGIELGSRDGCRFFIHGGFTYLHATTENFQQSVGNSNTFIVGNPTVSGWIFPSAKIGFEFLL